MKSRLVIFFLLISFLINAQHENKRAIAELSVDNDIVFLRDRYYSSGITLVYYSPAIKKSPLNKILLPHNSNEISYYALNITHRMYTPERTLTPEIQYTDHPYATYMLLGNSKTSYNYKKRIKKFSGIELGLIGSAAGGEFIQNILHENISIAIPSEGWHNQIQNDICIQYTAVIEKGLLNNSWFELNGFVGSTLGIPHTEAKLGGYLRLGYFKDYFKGLIVDVSAKWQAWLFWSGSVYLVNYNATLQGGTYIQNNVHTIRFINNSLLHTKFGAVIQFKRLSVEIAEEVRSPEFQTAFWHRWGHLNILFAF